MAGQSNEGRHSMISSFLGVMGRELQQFVLSAAGVNQLEINRSSSPVKDHSTYPKRRAPANEEIEERPRKRAKVEHPKRVARRSLSPERYEQDAFHRSQTISKTESNHEEGYERGSSLSLRRDISQEIKRGSLTMPGSFVDAEEEANISRRHVRFASENIETSQSSSPVLSPRRTAHMNLKPSVLLQESSYDTFSATPPPSTSDSEDYITPLKSQESVPEQQNNTTSGDATFRVRQISLSRPAEESILTFNNWSNNISKSSTAKGTPETSLQDLRIAELEREVLRLKEELALRTVQVPPPPPPPLPPPPPPPPPQLPQLPLHGGIKHTNSLLATARASLKTAPTSTHPTSSGPKPAPTSTRHAPSGLMPTVPADQMAAFLNEMKTVRLRKVGSKPDLQGSDATRRYPSTFQSRDRTFPKESIGPIQQARVSSADASTFNRPGESHKGIGSDLTPSLCSDKGELNEEDGSPPTPPLTLKSSAPVHRSGSGEDLPIDKPVAPRLSRPDNRYASSKTDRRVGEALSGDGVQPRIIHFPPRPPTSYQLPTLSPNRPRPPGRTGNGANTSSQGIQGIGKRLSDDEADPIALLPARGATAKQTQARTNVQVVAPILGKGKHPASVSRASDESLATGSISSLEHELRRIIRAEVEKEFEEELRELDNGERKRTKVHREHSRGASFGVENIRNESPESSVGDVMYSNKR